MRTILIYVSDRFFVQAIDLVDLIEDVDYLLIRMDTVEDILDDLDLGLIVRITGIDHMEEEIRLYAIFECRSECFDQLWW